MEDLKWVKTHFASSGIAHEISYRRHIGVPFEIFAGLKKLMSLIYEFFVNSLKSCLLCIHVFNHFFSISVTQYGFHTRENHREKS